MEYLTFPEAKKDTKTTVSNNKRYDFNNPFWPIVFNIQLRQPVCSSTTCSACK